MSVFNIKNNKKEVNRSIIAFPVFSKNKKFKYDFVQINIDKEEAIKKVDNIKIDEKFLEEFLQNQLPDNLEPILFNDTSNDDYKLINSYLIENFHKRKKDIVRKKERDKKIKEFFSLIPKINLSAVEWKIKKQFNNSKIQYINKHKLFVKFFTIDMKKLCDGEIHMDTKKKRKEALLYSSQLLGLVGKNGSSYLNDGLVTFYKDDMKRQEEFLLNYRLMTKKGKFVKLTTIEDKQTRRNAQILNISSCLSQMATDKGFTWSMVTLTLPASYHPSPTTKNSFNGVMPLEAHKQLNQYWQLIQSHMAKAGLRANTRYFGCAVFESHLDSCLHLHVMVYTSKEDQQLLKSIVDKVYNSSVEFGNYDFKESDGRASGATYIYKYIMKSNNTYTSDTHLKTTAVRYFYSARGFNFFGVKSCLTKFNFLINNHKNYKRFFCEDLREVFKSYDLYKFIKHYEAYFKIKRGENKAVQFVYYDLNGNRSEELRLKNTLGNKLSNQMLVIEKKIFSIFEISQEIEDKKIDSIEMVDMEDIKHLVIKSAYQLVSRRSEEYQYFIADFKGVNSQFHFVEKVGELNNNDIIDEKIEAQKERFRIKKLSKVRVNQSDSRKSLDGFPSALTFREISNYFHFPNEKEREVEEYLSW